MYSRAVFDYKENAIKDMTTFSASKRAIILFYMNKIPPTPPGPAPAPPQFFLSIFFASIRNAYRI